MNSKKTVLLALLVSFSAHCTITPLSTNTLSQVLCNKKIVTALCCTLGFSVWRLLAKRLCSCTSGIPHNQLFNEKFTYDTTKKINILFCQGFSGLRQVLPSNIFGTDAKIHNCDFSDSWLFDKKSLLTTIWAIRSINFGQLRDALMIFNRMNKLVTNGNEKIALMGHSRGCRAIITFLHALYFPQQHTDLYASSTMKQLGFSNADGKANAKRLTQIKKAIKSIHLANPWLDFNFAFESKLSFLPKPCARFAVNYLLKPFIFPALTDFSSCQNDIMSYFNDLFVTKNKITTPLSIQTAKDDKEVGNHYDLDLIQLPDQYRTITVHQKCTSKHEEIHTKHWYHELKTRYQITSPYSNKYADIVDLKKRAQERHKSQKQSKITRVV